MRNIILKTILIIDNEEILVNSQDFSESIAEYESEQEYTLDKDEVVRYIIQPWKQKQSS